MKKIAIIAVMAVLGASGASAATIVNGSFESPGLPDGTNYVVVNGGGLIPGWTAAGAGVDLVKDTLWQAADGNYSIDVNSTNTGAIGTTVTGLVIGNQYEVTFALSGNPSANVIARNNPNFNPTPHWVKYLQAYVGIDTNNLTRFDYSFDTQNTNYANMGWVDKSFQFVATANEMLLGFTSLGTRAWGAAIDDVRINDLSEVPLPVPGLLLLTGLGAMAAFRRKKG